MQSTQSDKNHISNLLPSIDMKRHISKGSCFSFYLKHDNTKKKQQQKTI